MIKINPYQCEIDLLSVNDWQRSNAYLFQTLIQNQQNWVQENHCDFWNNWVLDVFDIRTSNDFGLSVWAVILDESVYGTIEASPASYEDWGFGEERFNFNNGNFATSDDSGYNFTTEDRRKLLLLKAFILHMSGQVSEGNLSINSALSRIFGEGSIVCIDNRNMSFTYIIYDSELSGLAYEIYGRGLFPQPVGIKIESVIDGDTIGWGFGENNSNFNNGNFNNGQLI